MAADLAAALDPVAFAQRSGFEAEPWQAGVLRSTSRRSLLACARQVGKTTTVSHKAGHLAIYRPGSLVLIVSKAQRQSNEMLRKCRGVLVRSGATGRLVRESESELELDNGSRIVSLPGTDTTTRGFSDVKLLVIDEGAYVPEDVFYGVLPMVASDGVLMALSSPNGQTGWFFELWEQPGSGWEKHRVSVRESAQWDAQRIEEARAAMPAWKFSAECLAEFQDSDQQLFSSSAVAAASSAAVAPLFGGAA